MRKVTIEVPAENADPAVVEQLRTAARGLGDEVAENATASPNSYSLTVHQLDDEKKEGQV
jgi:hypothetical protein